MPGWQPKKVARYFADQSPKTGAFLLIFPKKARQNALLSRPDGQFFKKLTYDFSSVLNNEVPGENVHLVSKLLVLQQSCQKAARVEQKWHFFGFLVGTPPPLRWGALSLRGIGRSMQNYKCKWFFWRNVWRAEIWGSNIEALGQRRSKIRERDLKKGTNNYPLNSLTNFQIKN